MCFSAGRVNAYANKKKTENTDRFKATNSTDLFFSTIIPVVLFLWSVTLDFVLKYSSYIILDYF